MAQERQLKECTLYLVQYVPNLLRAETLNIGVLLHSPEEKYLGCLMTDDLRRVRRFHRYADVEFLRELQQYFEEQIDEHGEDLEAYLRYMRETFSNTIQLSSPHTCLLADPQAEIQELFARYVGPRLSGPVPQDTRLRIKQRLTAAFVRAGVWERLEKRIPAAQWNPGDPLVFDYGYRPLVVEGKPDAHIQFIHALSLRRDKGLAKELAYTMRRVQMKEPARLTAVVEGPASPDDANAQFSQRTLEEAGIRLQPLAGRDEYAQSVRRELLM